MAKRYEVNKTAYIECPCCEHEKIEKGGEGICPVCGYKLPMRSLFAVADEWFTPDARQIVDASRKWLTTEKDGARDAFNRGWQEEKMHGHEKTGYVSSTEKQKVYHQRNNGDIVERIENHTSRRSFDYIYKAEWESVARNYTIAAEGGHLGGLRRLGHLYARGEGVKKNLRTALCLICEAASQGSRLAQYWVMVGEGGLDDDDWIEDHDAFKLLSDLSSRGFKWAISALGKLYFHGKNGVEKDYEKAHELLLDAAKDVWEWNWRKGKNTRDWVYDNEKCGGSASAKRYLALCSFDGVGGQKQDIVAAYRQLQKIEPSKVRDDVIFEMLSRLDLWDKAPPRDAIFLSGFYHEVYAKVEDFVNAMECKGAYNLYAGYNEKKFSFDRRQLVELMDIAVSEYKKARGRLRFTILRDGALNSKIVKFYKKEFPNNLDACAVNSNTFTWFPFIGSNSIFGNPAGIVFQKDGILFLPSGINVNWINLLLSEVIVDDRDLKIGSVDISLEDVAKSSVSASVIADFLNHVRRVFLLDRKIGVKLLDGTRSVAEQEEKTALFDKIDFKKTKTSIKYSTKKRRTFILIGIFMGMFGIHYLYARRWFVFLLMLGCIGYLSHSDASACLGGLAESPVECAKAYPVQIGVSILWLLLWLGGTFFMKTSEGGRQMIGDLPSYRPKRKWFVAIGLIGGILGLHYLYAKRWFLFLMNLATFVTINNIKESSFAWCVLGAWLMLWLGGTTFIKKDGNGNTM